MKDLDKVFSFNKQIMLQSSISSCFRCFEWLSRMIVQLPVKLVVMLLTMIMLVSGILGISRLRMEFRPEWMLDPETECK